MSSLAQIPILKNSSLFEIFQLKINEDSLYSENDEKHIDQVLDEMVHLPFLSIVQKEGGTQFKLIVDYPGGGQALFNPMRFSRDQVNDKACTLCREGNFFVCWYERLLHFFIETI